MSLDPIDTLLDVLDRWDVELSDYLVHICLFGCLMVEMVKFGPAIPKSSDVWSQSITSLDTYPNVEPQDGSAARTCGCSRTSILRVPRWNILLDQHTIFRAPEEGVTCVVDWRH